MKSKVVSKNEALKAVYDGCTLMVGGFAATGAPNGLLEAIRQKGTKQMTLVCNDTGLPDIGVGSLVVNKQFKKAIVSHIGFNPAAVHQYEVGELEVELVPQGTLVERIRCGGFGLGGVLTPTGIGTEVAEGKQILEIQGESYILELPIKADVAIVRVSKADTLGNVVFHGTNVSHSKMMLTAADITIVEADEIVEAGFFEPDFVHMPSIFVDYVVQREG